MSEKVLAALTSIITKCMEKQEKLIWHNPYFGNPSSVPMNLIHQKPYRGINYLIGVMSGFASPYYLTRKQAAAMGLELDGKQDYTPIVKWLLHEDDDGNTKFRGMAFYQEFNLTQFKDWEKIPTPMKAIPVMQNDPIEDAEAIVAGYEGKPSIGHGDRAFYTPSADKVTIPLMTNFISAEHYYATLFHELAHSTGHERRLGRKGIMAMDGFGTKTYSFEELIAEITAAFLCHRINIDTKDVFDNSAAYLQSWLRKFKSDPSMLINAAQAAQKAQDHILGLKPPAKDEE
jgi:antirestriction protein ArdC